MCVHTNKQASVCLQRPWKYIERIPIDEGVFPSHAKPAAIIIGVKGSNHARMQDESGCCVQLRGRGISSVCIDTVPRLKARHVNTNEPTHAAWDAWSG